MNNNAIFGSPCELPLGYINPKDYGLNSLTDDFGDIHETRNVFVKRVATRDEYLAQFRNLPWHKQLFQEHYTQGFYYYEILMD